MEVKHSTDLLDHNLKSKSIEQTLNIVNTSPAVIAQKQSSLKTTNTEAMRNQHKTLMDRVKMFLPKIESANSELSKDNSDLANLDIENVEGCSKVVEMDIAFVENLKQTALQKLLEEIGSDTSGDDSSSQSDSSDSENNENT